MGDVDGLVPGGGNAKDDETLKKQGLLRHWAGEGGTGDGSHGSSMGTGLDVNWIVDMVRRGAIKLSSSNDSEQRKFTATVSGKATGVAEKNKKQHPSNPQRSKATKGSATTGYEISASEDAGRFLCEYIYRRSLEQAINREQGNTRKPWKWHNITPESASRKLRSRGNISKRVLFMHVPPEKNIYSIEQGIDCLLQVVVGIVMDGEGLRRVL